MAHDLHEEIYRPAWWLPGPHAQTIWSKLARPRAELPTRLERWDTPDGDFLDILRLDASPEQPRLFLLHGLEGTPRSHYVSGIFTEAHARGWAADLLIFRSCGAEPNRTARFYHSGETTDLDFALSRVLGEDPDAPVMLCGVSLGGNVLLKWLGERGDRVPDRIVGAAAVSTPYDLERGSRAIGRGFARVYEQHFLRTLRQKATAKLARFPGIFEGDALARAQSLYDFDDVVTARVHGFESAHDYYVRSSSLGFLDRIRRPTLLLNAMDDPFLPSEVLAQVRAIAVDNACLTVDFPAHGGHVGFVGGAPWRPVYYAERRVARFLEQRVSAWSAQRAVDGVRAHVDGRRC